MDGQRRQATSREGKLLSEIADLLIEIRDRLSAPAQDTPETGPVLVQEPETLQEVPPQPLPARRKPGRPRKVREAS